MRGVASPRVLLIALLSGIVAFGASFAIARSLGDDDATASAMPTRQLPERLVTISNLERSPTIKPLRSAAGAPPAARPAPAPSTGTP